MFYFTSFILFSLLQYSLVFSNNSIFAYLDYRKQLDTKYEQINKIKNDSIDLRKQISRLNEGNKSLEIYAREIFGYIKKDEIFVQIIKNDSANN